MTFGHSLAGLCCGQPSTYTKLHKARSSCTSVSAIVNHKNDAIAFKTL